ncbi:MAG TPA: hypothetical protein VE645_01445 [Pseudonocardiaceae bacterium]|nr:hypothetical protein [Pseudonocardiaceae bacterium]
MDRTEAVQQQDWLALGRSGLDVADVEHVGADVPDRASVSIMASPIGEGECLVAAEAEGVGRVAGLVTWRAAGRRRVAGFLTWRRR